MRDYRSRYEMEEREKWREWSPKIPLISFPAGWKVSPRPGWGGALVRMWIELPDGRKKSVYLDTENALGCYWDDKQQPLPYWEVHPVRGDCGRCDLDNVDELLSLIMAPDEE